MKQLLLGILGVSAAIFASYFGRDAFRRRSQFSRASWPPLLGVGFVLNFFDTLGIGSFAPTTAFYKFTNLVEDRQIPGTLNVGHCLPVMTQAFIFIAIVDVDPLTLVLLMTAAAMGGILGAGVVSRMPVNKIRIGLGSALLLVALVWLASLVHLMPSGGSATGLSGWRLPFAVVMTFGLGALQTIGIGIYAPCMALVYALGMDPRAAFPVMMGAAALLQPSAGLRFIRERSYDPKASLGLTLLGVPAVLIAAYFVKSLPLTALKWTLVAVILLASAMMFNSARSRPAKPAGSLRDEVVGPGRT